MSPSYRRRKAKSTRRSSSRRGAAAQHFLSSGENLESSAAPAAVSPAKPSKIGDLELDLDCGAICSTPKAERFRIPEITTCPPAPRKRRLLAAAGCSLRRRPMVFFAPPDIELFFYLALRGIPV